MPPPAQPPPKPGEAPPNGPAPGLLGRWSAALSRGLKRRGTLSLIVPAASLGEAVAALRDAQCPEITLHPLWRRAGEEARLIIVSGVRLGQGGCRVSPGLILHEPNGALTQATERILREGLPMTKIPPGGLGGIA